ncbi:hypothetical protein WISP_50984 [Willisornis vidua]|uniref:Uncharacterized protein n=1 Tax=Willisornis vidua TaxID=1566151 RepID=A0ABQ9DGK1_9PASS|nr:hypothetical protein WISP_50984 [Willisornis vidua]
MEQVLWELTQKNALADLMLVTRVDLVSELEIGGHDDGPRVSQCPELEDHDCENDQLTVNPEIVHDLLL